METDVKGLESPSIGVTGPVEVTLMSQRGTRKIGAIISLDVYND
jgi:hypothetical protein